jgi:drug/metabolite transporter (DMT)-like permease
MLGLILACFGSVFNVLTDASRKKILDRQYDAAVIGFWCKLVALGFYLIALTVVIACGFGLQLPPIGAALKISPALAFVLYLMLNALLEGTAILLNYRALQVSPLSFCVPFLALTPVFLLPIGKFFLHEQIVGGMVVGVIIVVIGSLVINRQLFANGWLEPAKEILRQKGSRYMMLVAFLLATTAALDKWFVTSGGDAAFGERLSRSFTLSIGKSVMLALFFVGLAWWRLRGNKNSEAVSIQPNVWTQPWRDVPKWILLAAFFEGIVLVLQLLAVQFTVAAIVISIKRSGILLACAVGWFMFKERGITDRVIGSCVMIAGVVIFFLTRPNAQGASLINFTGALGVAVAALIGMCIALHLTRHSAKAARVAVALPNLSGSKA